MKKTFLFSAILFLTLAIVTTSTSWAGGKGFYPGGQLQWETIYMNGEPSETKWYNETGQLLTRETYADGKTEKTEGYRADGAIEWQSTRLNDNRQQISRFDIVGQETVRYQVENGQPDGEYITFFADGQKKQVVTYKKGTLQGPAQTFFDSGQLEHEFSYLDGKVDGPYRTYSPEGVLLTEYSFSAGQLQ